MDGGGAERCSQRVGGRDGGAGRPPKGPVCCPLNAAIRTSQSHAAVCLRAFVCVLCVLVSVSMSLCDHSR